MSEQRQREWPHGDSEMARAVRSYPWTETPLGASEQWPERLRAAVEIMLDSAFPACIWWGPELIQLYNDAALTLYRYKHPRAFARPARVTWAHFWDTLGALAKEAIARDEPMLGGDLLLVTDERRFPEDGAWFSVSATPLRGDVGPAQGVLLTMVDTTPRMRAEHRVRASEVQAKKLFQQAPGIVLICRGPYHVVEFSNDAAHALIGGHALPGHSLRQIVFDFGGEPLLQLLDRAYRMGQRAEGLGLSIQTRNAMGRPAGRLYLDFAVVPIVDPGGAVSGTFVMGFDVTDRVEAQRILREYGERQAFLLSLSDAVRPLLDPIEVQAVAARAVGERLQVSRAFYCSIEKRGAEAAFVVDRDYHALDVSSTVGIFPAERFGSLVREILAGRSIAICDVLEETDLSESERAAYLEIGARAWCAVPLVKNGVVVAALCTHQLEAREWEDHEMALLEETAERTWAAVERARAELALHRSNELTRELADRTKVLVAELQHRTRNLISVIRTIAARTLTETNTTEEFAARFDARLNALGRAMALLSQTQEGEPLTFDALIRAELAAVAAVDDWTDRDRVSLEGPKGVSMRPPAIQTIALALHELMTNAVKHGALSNAGGHLWIRWSLDESNTYLRMHWQERGITLSPAALEQLSRRGFGRTLLEQALPHQLKAETRYVISADGVDCTIVLPVATSITIL